MIDLDYAASMGCRACGTPGGGCQFLGTAATSQVVAEALGIALPHSALSPSGESVWLDVAHRSALALLRLTADRLPLSSILTGHAVENAMIVHAAFGGSTNLLLHIPAIAHAAGLPMPEIEDWQRINRLTPRLVDALPNGPRNHPTVHVFAAGGVPEVMLHLRHMGLLNLDVITSTGKSLSEVLDWWEQSERRQAAKRLLEREAQIDPEQVIMDADSAKRAGLSGTLVFPVGNIAPQGSVIKATALDPTLVDHNGIYRHRGSARVFVSERDAIEAIKGLTNKPVRPGEVVVLVGGGPVGTGMEETYQVTSALKFIPWGKTVPVLTDARFSGVSTGACIGHIAPEALTDGPIGKLCDGDLIEIIIDCRQLKGSISFLGTLDHSLPPDEAEVVLNARPLHPQLQAHSQLSDDTRLWAALQRVSGGVWAGCVYDVERIITVIDTGLSALSKDG
jgi:putative YjhG/YagF family dehydratase